MPKQIFTWFPDEGSSLSAQPAVETTKFGDGYELRTSFSINTTPDKWSLTFTRAAVEAKAILAFLKAHGGKDSFAWETPNQEDGLYVCREWKLSRMTSGVLRVTCAFEQVFEV